MHNKDATTDDSRRPGVLSMHIHPRWEEIELARQKCEEFVKDLSLTDESSDSVRMIASELLENAVKYGAFTSLDETIPFRMEPCDRGLLVQTWNPLAKTGLPENLRRLDAMVQWIRSHQSPFQAYLERLKTVAARPLDDDESGLGLVRIAYEGEALLDFYVNEDDILYVSALLPLHEENNSGVSKNDPEH